jgi:hypothetical protein
MNKNDWKQQTPLNINTDCKWPKCPKRHRIANWLKNNTLLYVVTRTHLTKKINNGLELKGRKSFPSKWTHKHARVTILISDKVDFRQINQKIQLR